jgi:flagellar biosynthesis protein FlhG
VIGQIDRIRELENLNIAGNKNESSKIVAITSGKGGTGKTFFAANFAFQYSRSNKVLLVDMDFNLSNLHLLFNAHPQKTLNNYFDSKALFSEIISEYDSNLHLIFGDAGIVSNSKPTLYQIEKMFEELNKLSKKYDLIVIDLGAGVSEENLFVLSKSQTKIIVTNPEPTALMDAYVVVKLLKNDKSSDGIYITVNRCTDDSEGKQSFINLKSAVDHFLKVSINFLVEIPESTEVRKSIIDQKLLAEQNKLNSVIKSLNTSVSKINKIHQVFNINQSSVQSTPISLKNSL